MKKVAKKATAKKTSKSVSNKSIAIGAGVAALAAAAAGVYFMTGKHAKNRKKVSGWAKAVQKEVINDLEKVGKASKVAYEKSVDTVIKTYKDAKDINQADLLELADELKASWNAVKQELDSAQKSVKKVVGKKIATKTPAKTPKKKTSN